MHKNYIMEQIKHKGGVISRKLVLEFPEEISEKDLEDEEVLSSPLR